MSGLIRDGLEDVTRITIVTAEGNVFEDYKAYEGGVELSIQDEGRTLKVFARTEGIDD